MSDHINELYDADGNLIGALLSAEAWTAAKNAVHETLGINVKPITQKIAEPISDWEDLKQYWDYEYPVDTDVHCEHCGNKTEDWAADEPRLFRLSSANLAGLVAFKCQQCQAKILKRHYKDEVRTECIPYRESKTTSKEARYND